MRTLLVAAMLIGGAIPSDLIAQRGGGGGGAHGGGAAHPGFGFGFGAGRFGNLEALEALDILETDGAVDSTTVTVLPAGATEDSAGTIPRTSGIQDCPLPNMATETRLIRAQLW